MSFQSTPGSLLDAICQNPHDSELWTRLIDFTQPYLLYWVKGKLTSSEDQNDFLQDVYVKLLRLLPGFRYDRSRKFRGLLKKIAQSRYIDILRRNNRNAINGLSSLEVAMESEIPGFDEREFNAYLVKRALEVMKAEFSESDWKAVSMLIIDGKPAAEVAEELDRSLAAVYMAKSRVLKRIREILRGLMD